MAGGIWISINLSICLFPGEAGERLGLVEVSLDC